MEIALIIVALVLVVITYKSTSISGNKVSGKKDSTALTAKVTQSSRGDLSKTPDLQILQEAIVEMACQQCGMGIRSDKLATDRIRESAAGVLKDLQKKGSAEINLPYLTATSDGPKHFNATIDLKTLNEFIK